MTAGVSFGYSRARPEILARLDHLGLLEAATALPDEPGSHRGAGATRQLNRSAIQPAGTIRIAR